MACKATYPEARVFATDISTDALALARANAADLGLGVTFLEGDLFGPLPAWLHGSVDLLVANPPYVAAAESAALPKEIRNFEPMEALVAGELGTEVLARIAAAGARWLAPRGVIACEIGESQGADCLDLFAAYDPRIECDLAGRDRYVLGRVR